MLIVADTAIPFVNAFFESYGMVSLIAGHEIDLRSIKTADALLVRTQTRVDAALLGGTSVRFVGSATAGVDHIDLDYLEAHNIHFVSAPGANSHSVVEYVLTALFELSWGASQKLTAKTVGVIGSGAVGGCLVRRLKAFGVRTLVCDPPLEQEALHSDEPHSFVSLDFLLRESDIISLHVPLIQDGKFATKHLMDADALGKCRRGTWLLNTSRGGVVDERALLSAVASGAISRVVTDVWDDEPLPAPEMIQASHIATSHIAGYSIDAKRRATRMIRDAYIVHFKLERYSAASEPGAAGPGAAGSIELLVPETDPKESFERYCRDLVLQMYPIMKDHHNMTRLRSSAMVDEDRAESFRQLRSNYAARFGFYRYRISDSRLRTEQIRRLSDGLGIKVVA